MNETRIGQWVRITFGTARIGKVVGYQEWTDMYYVDTGDGKYILDLEYFKSSDNLVDLLEVGDIVHYDYDSYIMGKVIKNDFTVIENEFDIHFLKGSKSIKITAIELHENRNKQMIVGGG